MSIRIRMSPAKLGWCLDNHHDKCWRVSVSGVYCACDCHIDESGKPKAMDSEAQTPDALRPFLEQKIQEITAGNLTPATQEPADTTVAAPKGEPAQPSQGEPAPSTEGIVTMTEMIPPEGTPVTPASVPAEASAPVAAPVAAPVIPPAPSVPATETETLEDIAAEAEAPAVKPRKTATEGGTSLAALKQLSREELNERREKHVKHAALPTKTAEWHAKQVVKIDGILGGMAE